MSWNYRKIRFTRTSFKWLPFRFAAPFLIQKISLRIGTHSARSSKRQKGRYVSGLFYDFCPLLLSFQNDLKKNRSSRKSQAVNKLIASITELIEFLRLFMSAPNPNLLTPYSPIYRDTTTDFLNLTEEEKTARVQTFSRAFDKYSNAIFDAEETKAVILNPSYFNFLKTKEEMLTDLQQNLDHLYLKLSASRIRISEDMEPLPKAYNVKDPINHWESYLETLHIARFKNRADDYESEVMNLQKQAEKYPDFLALKCDSLDEQYKALQNKAREFPKLQRFLPKDYTEVIDVFRKSVKSYNPRNKCICHY